VPGLRERAVLGWPCRIRSDPALCRVVRGLDPRQAEMPVAKTRAGIAVGVGVEVSFRVRDGERAPELDRELVVAGDIDVDDVERQRPALHAVLVTEFVAWCGLVSLLSLEQGVIAQVQASR